MVRGLAATLLSLGTCVAFGAPAAAQAPPPRPPFTADRPGLGDGAGIVGRGLWQVEAGATIHAETYDEYLVGNALLRLGLAGLEVRVSVPPLLIRNQDTFLQVGDLAVGVKVPLELGGRWWRWAATGTLALPTGSELVKADGAGGAAGFIGEVELAGDVALAFNAGYGFLFDEPGGGTGSLVATPTFPVPGRPDLQAYVGYGLFLRPGDDEHFVEWGITRQVGPDRQWDLNAGYDPGSHTWFLGAGLAHRGGW